MEYRKVAIELLDIWRKVSGTEVCRKMNSFVIGEYFVLNYLLNSEKRVYSKDISREMDVTTARVAAILNQIEKKGWIERTQDCDDNRQTIVSITEEGIKVIREKRREITDEVVTVLEKIGEKDAEELLRIQRKIIE